MAALHLESSASPSRHSITAPRGQPLYQPSPPRSSSTNAMASSSSSGPALSPFRASQHPQPHLAAHDSPSQQPPPPQPYFSPTRLAPTQSTQGMHARHPPVSPSRQANTFGGPPSGNGGGSGSGFSLRPTHSRTRSAVPVPFPDPQSQQQQQKLAPPTSEQGIPALQQRQSINTRLAGLTQQYPQPRYREHQQQSHDGPSGHVGDRDLVDEGGYRGAAQGSQQMPYGQHVQQPYPSAQQAPPDDPYANRNTDQYSAPTSEVAIRQYLSQSYYAAQQQQHSWIAPDRHYTYNRASTSGTTSTSPTHPVSIQTDGASLPLSAVGQPRGYAYQQDRRTPHSGYDAAHQGARTDAAQSPVDTSPVTIKQTSLSPQKSMRSPTKSSHQKDTHISPVSVKRSESRNSIFSGENSVVGSDKTKIIRRSRSSDLLRRISRGKSELISGGAYVPLTAEEQDHAGVNHIRSDVGGSDEERRRHSETGMVEGHDVVERPEALYIPPVQPRLDDPATLSQLQQYDYSEDSNQRHNDPGHTDDTVGTGGHEPLLPPRLGQFSSQHSLHNGGLSHSDSMPLLAQLPSSFPMPPRGQHGPFNDSSDHRSHLAPQQYPAVGTGYETYGGDSRQQVNPSPGQYDDPASSEFAAAAQVPDAETAFPEEEELYEEETNERRDSPGQHHAVTSGQGSIHRGENSSLSYTNPPHAASAIRPPSQLRSGSQSKRISDPATGLHSRNAALFEAERGGKALHFYEEDGTWSANSLVPTPLQNGSLAGRARRRSTGEALVLSKDERERLAARKPSATRQLSAGAPVGQYQLGPSPGGVGGEQYDGLGEQVDEEDRRARPWSATTDPVPHVPAQSYLQPLEKSRQNNRPHTSHANSHPSSRNSNDFDDPNVVNLEKPYFPQDDHPGGYPYKPDHPRRHVRSLSEGATLLRHGTLLHPASDPQRAGQELSIMLGNRRRRPSGSKLLPAPIVAGWDGGMAGVQQEKVKLEAAKKGRARVEVDVVLERECVVEGGEIRGRIEVKVGKRGVRVGMGKVRVVGYEDVSPQNRHIFYQHAHTLPVFEHPAASNGPRTSLFVSGPDSDGFHEAKEGMHFIPFSMRLPLRGGAKGAFTSPNNPKGPGVRYVVVGSIKVSDQTHSGSAAKRSIAHFYRPVVVLPYLNPGVVLAPSEETVEVVERRGLGWSLGGNKGSVELRIALGRSIWVSGQRVWCEVGVRNDSSKKVKSLTLALLQTVTTFLPDDVIRKNSRLSVDKDGIPNADEALGIASTTRRKVAEETIEADDTDWGHGQVTGKQWWTGVQPGEMGGWDLSLLIPNGMITISRSRLVEVTYTLRLTANGSIYVDVPVVLINFLSIDPPPMPGDGARLGNRVPISVHGDEMRNMGVASTSGHSHPNDGIYKEGSQHSGDSFKGIARASSTTLHIDALLAAGRARAGDDLNIHSGDELARSDRYHRPASTYSDYTPEPTSSKSHLGTVTTSRSMPGGLREPYHNRSIDRRRHLDVDPANMGGATPARPKVPRVMSYLSVHSSELDQPLSDEEREDDDDEIGKTLREAARREGRKMSLAALTRAAEREKADVMGSAATEGAEEVLEMDASGSAEPEAGDVSDVTPKMGMLQIFDQTPIATPAMLSAPLPVRNDVVQHPGPAGGVVDTDVRSEIKAHTPVSDGLEQIDEVEESSQIGDEESFRISAYGGIHTDDEPGSRPDSRDLDWAPTSSKALQGYSEDLLQPIAVLPELSLDDVLRERKWSMDMRGLEKEAQVELEEEDDDDDKPLALIAKASPKADGMATPRRAAQTLDVVGETDRTPTRAPATPMSPPFAYDQPSPVLVPARLPPAPQTPPSSAKQEAPKVYENTLFNSTSSLGGTGLTGSTNRVPSRKGSALDPQTLLRVSDERNPPTLHRYESRFGSFAASTSAMSDQESEIGQVVQAVKRNLSVKNKAEVIDMDSRYADEEGDGQEEPAISTPPLSPRQDRSGHAVVRGGRSPVKWSQSQLTPTLQPSSGGSQMRGPRAMGKSSSYFFDARRRSSGISPRTNYLPVVGDSSASAPMTRTASALRNQVPLEAPVSQVLDSPMQEPTEEGTLPPLAPSVDGDSSSDGHVLDSPHLLDTPGRGLDRAEGKGLEHDRASQIAHQQLLDNMRNLASPTPKSDLNSPMTRQHSKDTSNGPQLDPDWVPGDHLLHTEVAFARTSFSLPAGPTSDDTHSHAHTMTSHHSHSHSSSIPSMPTSRNNSDGFSPLRRPSQSREYGTRSSRGHGMHGHGQRSTSPTPTAASVRSMKSAHSSHSVVLSGMQYKLQHMQARDEALRKFSVASAASSGRRESMLGDVESDPPALPVPYGAQQGNNGYQGYGNGEQQRYMGQRQLGLGQPGGQIRMTKPRKSYTAALGPRT